MKTKRWYQSKTIWINALTLAAAIVAALQHEPALQEYAALIISIQTIINILLRFMSTDKLQ